jgi:3-hydroxyisobutyrate dehydrogenase
MASVAFLGTGTMGLPMARNLAKRGFQLRAWNRSPDRAQPLAAEGAEVFEDPRQAVDGVALLVTMLSDANAVLELAAKVLDSLRDDAVWIQMSTIGIEATERCAERAEQAGLMFVDAPVLGTREPAESAKLVILASGPADARERCESLFDALGSRTLWLGEAGEGTRCKVVVNSWIVGVVAVLAETISLAEVLGVDPRRFFEAVEGGPLDLPYARMKGAQMIERSFDDPSFRLSLARKDAQLILAASADVGLELPVMDAITTRLLRAEQDGHGDEDMAATYWATAPQRTPPASAAGHVCPASPHG